MGHKYYNVLLPFMQLMRKELFANANRGDREGWLGMTANAALEEIEHHRRKLNNAVAYAWHDEVKEHAADVANCSLMLLDVMGLLPVQEPGWTHAKPKVPGAYWIRGESMGLARTCLVEVAVDDGLLMVNLHQSTSQEEFGFWYPVLELNDAFEWLGPLVPVGGGV